MTKLQELKNKKIYKSIRIPDDILDQSDEYIVKFVENAEWKEYISHVEEGFVFVEKRIWDIGKLDYVFNANKNGYRKMIECYFRVFSDKYCRKMGITTFPEQYGRGKKVEKEV